MYTVAQQSSRYTGTMTQKSHLLRAFHASIIVTVLMPTWLLGKAAVGRSPTSCAPDTNWLNMPFISGRSMSVCVWK